MVRTSQKEYAALSSLSFIFFFSFDQKDGQGHPAIFLIITEISKSLHGKGPLGPPPMRKANMLSQVLLFKGIFQSLYMLLCILKK